MPDSCSYSVFKMNITKTIRNLLTRWSWDVRVRNEDVAHVVQDVLDSERSLLDAGCGENLFANYFFRGQVLGVDIARPTSPQNVGRFVTGSILRLPLQDDSFDWAVSIDVLEHLPENLRTAAVSELVRVVRSGVVIAFPFDGHSRELDEQYFIDLQARHHSIPEWLEEHLRQPYPQIESVLNLIATKARANGFEVRSSVLYSENIRVTRMLRWCSIRSKIGYLFLNLLFGILLPVMPRKLTRKGSYRAILIARFH